MTNKKLVSIDESSLPRDWKALTLADVTEYIQRGKGPKYVEHSELPVINQKCIRWFGIQKEHLKYVDPAQWGAWAPERYVRAGDILWNSTGTGTIGRASLVKSLSSQEKYVVDSHVTIVRPKDVDSQYVHYWIMSPAVQGSIEAMQSGSTNQVELSKSAVEALPIPVAPPDQQKRIVAEIEKQFSRLDEAVANLKRVRANLKRYKAAVLKAAVEGRLVETEAELARREGRSYEPGEQLLQRILETRRSQWQGKGKYKEPAAPDTTDLPDLPEGWVWATADQLTDENRAITYGVIKLGEPVDDGVPVLRSSDVRQLRIDLDDVKRISPEIAENYRRTFLKGGEVVMTVRGTLGGIAVVPPQCNGFNVSREVAMLALVDPQMAKLVALFVASAPLANWLMRRTKGIAYTGINIETLKALPIPVPPIAEHKRILAEVDCRLSVLRETAAQVEANILRAERLRQVILSDAFSGQLQQVSDSAPEIGAHSYG